MLVRRRRRLLILASSFCFLPTRASSDPTPFATDAIVADNQEIVNSTSQLETIEGELSEIISEVIRQFATLLPAATEGKDEWESWWIEGWLREFCRSVSRVLVSFSDID